MKQWKATPNNYTINFISLIFITVVVFFGSSKLYNSQVALEWILEGFSTISIFSMCAIALWYNNYPIIIILDKEIIIKKGMKQKIISLQGATLTGARWMGLKGTRGSILYLRISGKCFSFSVPGLTLPRENYTEPNNISSDFSLGPDGILFAEQLSVLIQKSMSTFPRDTSITQNPFHDSATSTLNKIPNILQESYEKDFSIELHTIDDLIRLGRVFLFLVGGLFLMFLVTYLEPIIGERQIVRLYGAIFFLSIIMGIYAAIKRGPSSYYLEMREGIVSLWTTAGKFVRQSPREELIVSKGECRIYKRYGTRFYSVISLQFPGHKPIFIGANALSLHSDSTPKLSLPNYLVDRSNFTLLKNQLGV